MTAMTMEFNGVRELTLDEIDEVSGALGVPGAIIGFVFGAVGAGAAYIATHAGGGTSGDASAGGAIAAIAGGGLTGAAAGFTGGYIGMGIAAVGGTVTAGTSAAIDNANN